MFSSKTFKELSKQWRQLEVQTSSPSVPSDDITEYIVKRNFVEFQPSMQGQESLSQLKQPSEKPMQDRSCSGRICENSE